MTALQSNDLPVRFAPGAMAAAPVSQASGHRWAGGGGADATPGSTGGSDTPPEGAGPSRSDGADGHDWSEYGS
jgi:hypothetical protein